MRVIKTFENTTFMTFEGGGVDENDICRVRFSEPITGTVVYAAGMVEGDDDALVALGAADGSDEFRIVYHPGFIEFEKGWYALIGRNDLLTSIYPAEDNEINAEQEQVQ